MRLCPFYESEDVHAVLVSLCNCGEGYFILDIAKEREVLAHRYYLVALENDCVFMWRIRNLYRFICRVQEQGREITFSPLGVREQLMVFEQLVGEELVANADPFKILPTECIECAACLHQLVENDSEYLGFIAQELGISRGTS